MKRFVLLSAMLMFVVSISAQSDYYRKKAEDYQREAEYYQKKAAGHYREAEYYLKQAKNYQREVEYYTRQGDYDKARTYSGYVEREMDKYSTEMRLASQAEEKVTMYLDWAADALRNM